MSAILSMMLNLLASIVENCCRRDIKTSLTNSVDPYAGNNQGFRLMSAQ